MNGIEFFSESYDEARKRFCDAAGGDAGWSQREIVTPGVGPKGEALNIDVAVSACEEGLPTLVLSSGLHGVEGYFGSAVQLAILDRYRRSPPPVSVLMWHGLNPYGFAWDRRFDENNIDLNRNFLLDGQEFVGCPEGYRMLDPLLNPQVPPREWDGFRLKALKAIARHGVPALRQAVAGGQYEFARGLFFGGHEAAYLQKILEDQQRKFLDRVDRVVHLDFHTGLGRWGVGKLLIDTPLDATREVWFRKHFGEGAFEAAASEAEAKEGMAYQASGSLGCWCVSRRFVDDYRYACAEFGTYSPLKVLSALRRENQAHHWSESEAAVVGRVKRELRNVFCPENAGWRRMAMKGALKFVDQAILGLTEG